MSMCLLSVNVCNVGCINNVRRREWSCVACDVGIFSVMKRECNRRDVLSWWPNDVSPVVIKWVVCFIFAVAGWCPPTCLSVTLVWWYCRAVAHVHVDRRMGSRAGSRGSLPPLSPRTRLCAIAHHATSACAHLARFRSCVYLPARTHRTTFGFTFHFDCARNSHWCTMSIDGNGGDLNVIIDRRNGSIRWLFYVSMMIWSRRYCRCHSADDNEVMCNN